MNRRLLLSLAALVAVASYLGGALAPPLRSMVSAAPSITVQQWVAVNQGLTELLDQNWQLHYLPMIMR